MKKVTFLTTLLGIAQMATAQTDSIAHDLRDVIITGTRTRVSARHVPFDVTVVDRGTLTQDHRPNLLPTLTEEVPGLFTTSRGVLGYGVSTNAAGGISLRGLAGGSGQMMVLIDGTPQYQGIYGHPISDSYQTLMAERVEVMRGPACWLYGSNAMGGVVNIVTRRPHSDGSHTNANIGAGSYGTVQTELGNDTRLGRFSSTVAAQYGRSDNQRPNMGFEQYGGFVRLGYDFSAHWNLSAEANLTHFNASNPGLASNPLAGARQWITRGAATLSLENHYGKTNGRITLYDNFGRHKINDGWHQGEAPTKRYFRSRDALAGVSWYQAARLFKGNTTTVGLDYQHIYGRAYYTSMATGEVIETPNKQSGHSHRNEVAGYVDFRQDLANWLTVDAGIRLDHHSITGNEWVPQGGVAIRPLDNGALKLMVSKGFRNPTMREMYLYPPSSTDLKPEKIMNYELSWQQSLAATGFSYGINVFYLKGDNMIQTVRVDGRPRNVNTGIVENTGAELQASWRIDRHWSVTTNHSVLHMHHLVLGAPEYKGYLGGTLEEGKWRIHAGIMQLSGLITNTTTQHHENATLVNATIDYCLSKGVSLWAKGDNLLAQHYEINEGFPMPRATFMGGVNLSF